MEVMDFFLKNKLQTEEGKLFNVTEWCLPKHSESEFLSRHTEGGTL